MKQLFLSLVAMMAVAVSFAQNTLVATLSHGEDISMYYGTYALREAYNAAVSGDIINLSGGAFQSTDIKKGITLRGTGIDDTNPTNIINNFTINIPEDDTNRLSMEGIRCTGHIMMSGTFANLFFTKCQFNSFEYNENAVIKNTMFVACKITGDNFSLKGTSSALFINSYVSGFDNWNETTAGATFINCVMRPRYSDRCDYMRSSQFYNCIFYITSLRRYALPSTSSATNCVGIHSDNNFYIFQDLQSKAGCIHSTYVKIFKTFTGTYSDTETFELTDAAKAQFLGIDGTEIGMHGGVLPYDSTPSYPQITKMNVANKTTADGKLSVEIEVSAAE